MLKNARREERIEEMSVMQCYGKPLCYCELPFVQVSWSTWLLNKRIPISTSNSNSIYTHVLYCNVHRNLNGT